MCVYKYHLRQLTNFYQTYSPLWFSLELGCQKVMLQVLIECVGKFVAQSKRRVFLSRTTTQLVGTVRRYAHDYAARWRRRHIQINCISQVWNIQIVVWTAPWIIVSGECFPAWNERKITIHHRASECPTRTENNGKRVSGPIPAGADCLCISQFLNTRQEKNINFNLDKKKPS